MALCSLLPSGGLCWIGVDREIQYNNSMNKELQMQLKSVNNEIAAFVSGDFKDEVFVVASDEFRDGYLHGLQMQKEWLEAMIANFCE